jgi:hypothetical protein
MHKEIFMFKHSLLIILTGARDLCAYSAQFGLLGICLAAAWKVKPLVISAAKCSLRVLVDPSSPEVHFGVSTTKSRGRSMPCRW